MTTKDKPSTSPTKTNGMAVAGFVCALATTFTGISAILGLIFSIVGLSQIKKTGEDGRGLAIAGIIISSVLMFIGIIVIILFIVFGIMAANEVTKRVDIDCGYQYEYVDGEYKSSYRCD